MGCGTSTLRGCASGSNAVVPVMQKRDEDVPDPSINAEVESAFTAATATAAVITGAAEASAEAVASAATAVAVDTRGARATPVDASTSHEAAGARKEPEASSARAVATAAEHAGAGVPGAEMTPVVVFHVEATVAAPVNSTVPPLATGALRPAVAHGGPLDPIKGLGRAALEPIVSLQKQRAPLPPPPALLEHAVLADQGAVAQHLPQTPTKEEHQPLAAHSPRTGPQPAPPIEHEQQSRAPPRQEHAGAVRAATKDDLPAASRSSTKEQQPVAFPVANSGEQSPASQWTCAASKEEHPVLLSAAAETKPPHSPPPSTEGEQPGRVRAASKAQQPQAAGAPADFRASAPETDREGSDDAADDTHQQHEVLPDDQSAGSFQAGAPQHAGGCDDAHSDDVVAESTPRASAAVSDECREQPEPDSADEGGASVDGAPLTRPAQPAVVQGARMAAFPTLTEGSSTAVFGIGATSELAATAAEDAPAANVTTDESDGGVCSRDGPLRGDLIDGEATDDQVDTVAKMDAVVEKDTAEVSAGVHGARTVDGEHSDAADDSWRAAGDPEHEITVHRRIDGGGDEEELLAEESGGGELAAAAGADAANAVHDDGELASADAEDAAVSLCNTTGDEDLQDCGADAPRATMVGDSEAPVGAAGDETLDDFGAEESAPADGSEEGDRSTRSSAKVEAAAGQGDLAESAADGAEIEEAHKNRVAADEGPEGDAAAAEKALAANDESSREQGPHDELRASYGGAQPDDSPDKESAQDDVLDRAGEDETPIELEGAEAGQEAEVEAKESSLTDDTSMRDASARACSAGEEQLSGDCVAEDTAAEDVPPVETEPVMSDGPEESEQANGDAEESVAFAADGGAEGGAEDNEAALDEEPADEPGQQAGEEAGEQVEDADTNAEAPAEAEEAPAETEEPPAELPAEVEAPCAEEAQGGTQEAAVEEDAPAAEDAPAEAEEVPAEAPADAETPVEEEINTE